MRGGTRESSVLDCELGTRDRDQPHTAAFGALGSPAVASCAIPGAAGLPTCWNPALASRRPPPGPAAWPGRGGAGGVPQHDRLGRTLRPLSTRLAGPAGWRRERSPVRPVCPAPLRPLRGCDLCGPPRPRGPGGAAAGELGFYEFLPRSHLGLISRERLWDPMSVVSELVWFHFCPRHGGIVTAAPGRQKPPLLPTSEGTQVTYAGWRATHLTVQS